MLPGPCFVVQQMIQNENSDPRNPSMSSVGSAPGLSTFWMSIQTLMLDMFARVRDFFWTTFLDSHLTLL